MARLRVAHYTQNPPFSSDFADTAPSPLIVFGSLCRRHDVCYAGEQFVGAVISAAGLSLPFPVVKLKTTPFFGPYFLKNDFYL
jgi:hypothetical protein